MTRTLFVHCSPHGRQAYGYLLAREIIDRERRLDSASTLVERDLSSRPLPALSPAYAAALTEPVPPEPGVFEVSDRLIDELRQSDRLIVATPIHNFTVPAALKLWIDHVVRVHRTFASTPQGKMGLLTDRPATILVSSGGFHQSGRGRQPDFLSPYLARVLNTVGIVDITFVFLEGLASGKATVTRALERARRQLVERGLIAPPVQPSRSPVEVEHRHGETR